ncbi:MAG: LysM peptidoglycan-binding domain-containing protein [Spirochaetia bacterium]
MRLFRLVCVFVLAGIGGLPVNAQSEREKDFERFREAFLRAESVQAQTYANDLVEKAQTYMSDARLATKPENRTSLVNAAIDYLHQAYEKSLSPHSQTYIKKLQDLLHEMESADIAKYAQIEFKKIQSQVEKTIASIKKNHMNDETQFMFDRTWQNMQDFSKTTDMNLSIVSKFLDMVRERCADLLPKNTNINAAFSKAEIALASAALKESLDNLKEVMHLANKALATDEFFGRLKKVDTQLFLVKDELWKANRLFVIRAGGVIESPKPFNGDQYLSQNPLVESPSLPALFENKHYESLELVAYHIVEVGAPIPSKIEVAGEISTEGLFEQAISLWKDGVTLRNAGHLDEAIQYFEKSRDYLMAFKREAVSKVYTVQKRTSDKHDTLWRIAGFKDIYNNPYLWPLLWERNKTQIDDPDRLEPGQRLLIPAID